MNNIVEESETTDIENARIEMAKLQNNISQLVEERNKIESELMQIPVNRRSASDVKLEKDLEKRLKNINAELNENKKKLKKYKEM